MVSLRTISIFMQFSLSSDEHEEFGPIQLVIHIPTTEVVFKIAVR